MTATTLVFVVIAILLSFGVGFGSAYLVLKKKTIEPRTLCDIIELTCLISDNRSYQNSEILIKSYAQRILKILDYPQFKKMGLPENYSIFLHENVYSPKTNTNRGEILEFSKRTQETKTKDTFEKIKNSLD